MSEEFYAQRHYSGVFYYPWVIGGIVFVLVVGLSYVRFLWHLPPRMRLLFMLSAGLYVGGALGFEAVEAWFDERYGFKNLTYQVLAGIEELCEMAGIAIFVYTFMRYAASINAVVAIRFHRPPARADS